MIKITKSLTGDVFSVDHANSKVVFDPGGSFGSATHPTIAFGDGDTGFYESADDVLRVSTANSNNWNFSGASYFGTNANGPQMRNEAASATVSTFEPNRADDDTGIGSAAADNVSMVCGGLEAGRFEDPADLAATETSLWIYDLDNGAIQQVTVGADDSGGAGFKLLRTAN